MQRICFSCAGCGMIKKHDFLHKAGVVLFLVAQAEQLFGDTEAAALPALLESGRLPARISGLPASARALLAASMHAQLDAPVLAVCPDEAAAELFQKDLSALLGQDVPLLTARDYTFYTVESVSRQTEQKRLSALYALAAGTAPAVVCTVSGLLQRAMPKEKLLQAAFEIRDGSSLPPEDAEDALLRCGYLRTAQVEGPGQFSRRGGILDFFSPAYPQPVRVEFWGDDVDSMGFFDPESQRRTQPLDSCRILPAAETLPPLYPGGSAALGEKLQKLAGRAAAKKDSDTAQKLDGEKLCADCVLPAADRYMGFVYDTFATALDYLAPEAAVLIDQPARCAERAKEYTTQLREDIALLVRSGTMAARAENFYEPFADMMRRVQAWPIVLADGLQLGRSPIEARTLVSLTAKQLPSYGGSSQTAADDIAHYRNLDYRVVVLAGDMRRARILCEFLDGHGIHAAADEHPDALPEPGQCLVTPGSLSAGIEFPYARLAILTDTQIAASGLRRARHKKQTNREKINSYTDLSVGDLVVHEYHGIGRFAGIVQMPVDGAVKDYIKISYAGADTLYVPATQLDLVSKYIGAGEDRPVKLSKMGGTEWARTKTRAKAAAKSMAKELTALYAARSRTKGHAFAPDSPWQTEFEEHFGYPETDDQLRCIDEIKADMEKPVPMDRLLCGDVGYGKTEVALRAVMKCVLDGRQAAILVPTTVLAQQHYQTAVQRFYGFPVEIRMLSRFCSQGQIRQTLADMRSGKCDLVIGTHKLLQKNIEFKNLGLLIVDEEQRFGVAHKEKLKQLSRNVDVLTLTATPIPRTLNMAMSGIRDMSVLEEAPGDRFPVQSYVLEYDDAVIGEAIRRELRRGGQVFYLHNRVETIFDTAARIRAMAPEARVVIAHGQTDREGLSDIWRAMVNNEADILVSTTIIETGVDIPNANTLIIERADCMGLSQLHQIRGRVGRSNRRAYAYFTYPRGYVLSEEAQKRLMAIREYTEFGSGFKVALRDLEIRGAGNLLGSEQHGHIDAVGYDMYMKLLNDAVLEEKGVPSEKKTAECTVDISVDAYIPEKYIAAASQRMDAYKKIASVQNRDDLRDVEEELRDRYGDLPVPVRDLLDISLLRSMGERCGIVRIEQKQNASPILRPAQTDPVIWTLLAGQFRGQLLLNLGAQPYVTCRLKKGEVALPFLLNLLTQYADLADARDAENAKNSEKTNNIHTENTNV
mgnify:CR=1 FL=1